MNEMNTAVVNETAPVAEVVAPVAEVVAPVAEVVAPVKSKRKNKVVKSKKNAKNKTVKVKAGRGRPAIYVGFLLKQIVRVIKANGLTGARKVLASEGVQQTGGAKKKKLSISLPTLGKIAEANGIELQVGRPVKKAA